MSTRVWVGGAVASVLLHGAGFAALSLSTEPNILPDQPVPKSQFSIEAAEVPRSRATPQDAKAPPADEASATAPRAQSGTIAQSRAEPAQAPSTQAAAVAPQTNIAQDATKAASTLIRDASAASAQPAQPVAAVTNAMQSAAPVIAKISAQATLAPSLRPALQQPAVAMHLVATASSAQQAEPVAAVTNAVKPAAPVLAKVSARTMLAPSLRPAPQPSTVAPVAVAMDIRPATTARPDVVSVALASSKGAPAAAAKPASQTAAARAPDAPQSAALPLPAIAGTAALAWSGGDDMAVSETSLAAIAAFTQAGDLTTASTQVRDGIAGILAAVPCARLQTTFLPDTGQLELRGHIPDGALRGPVLAALREQVGDAIPLSDQLLILPRPQCGALAGIANVGLPQSTEQLSDPAVIGEDGFARTYTYLDGERLQLDLAAPDYDSYIYMDYFVADGSVIHLQPNDIVPLEFASAKSTQSVGRVRADKPYLELVIGAPFGQEIAAAFASSVPLYDGVRPIQEPAEAYLAFLKTRVAAARAAHPDFKGEWVYFFISTKAK